MPLWFDPATSASKGNGTPGRTRMQRGVARRSSSVEQRRSPLNLDRVALKREFGCVLHRLSAELAADVALTASPNRQTARRNEHRLGLRRQIEAGGDLEYLKVFGRRDAAEEWLALHDPKGVAHQCPVIGEPRMIRKPIP
jgi:hypothetical protein